MLVNLVRGVVDSARVGIGAALVLAAFAVPAFACATCGGTPPPSSVPEIDPGSIASALTLLSGGVLMLTNRLRAQ